jgi:hypothetical protein
VGKSWRFTSVKISRFSDFSRDLYNYDFTNHHQHGGVVLVIVCVKKSANWCLFSKIWNLYYCQSPPTEWGWQILKSAKVFKIEKSGANSVSLISLLTHA